MIFKKYNNENYEDVCNFLIELNKESKEHINWNWARFEWMMEHPEFKKELSNSIGLWIDEEKIVGAAIFDMYFGEASCLALKNYSYLYKEIIEYAYNNLKDDNGLGIAINTKDNKLIELVTSLGFTISNQKETVMSIDLDKTYKYQLPDGFKFEPVDIEKDIIDIEWLFWRGFDHGNDYNEFLKENSEHKIPNRPHLNPYLVLTVSNSNNEKIGYCSMWYNKNTDYAYLEPLCVVAEYRKMGIGKSLVYELLNRSIELGANKAYVISDLNFYSKLGFKDAEDYQFFTKV